MHYADNVIANRLVLDGFIFGTSNGFSVVNVISYIFLAYFSTPTIKFVVILFNSRLFYFHITDNF